MQKVVFIDRDGVINQEVGYLHKIKDFVFIDGVFAACKYLQNQGFKLIIITNQSGIGRGYYQNKDYQILTNWMLQKFRDNGILISNIFHCPHAPNDNCSCRKPQTGMFEKANNLHKIDKQNSWMIGDKEDDITAANNFGIFNTILVESGHKINKHNTQAKFILPSIKAINGVI
jgi:D-glycero-D-manno-heptose 1,7-bisphosphate phosphatase